MPFLACWRAARLLHELLLEHVLKAPLQFFEVTPVGRILTRFSKDVEVLDTALPSQISDLMWCIFEVIPLLPTKYHLLWMFRYVFGDILLRHSFTITQPFTCYRLHGVVIFAVCL
ncbi:unnamed protein product [Chrysodeixis includens]|uniref:ABC transmembrane type-1 domain-containing protein n=1 Tax=Chrysodeixis includens TaxID=689277 RepID=A0A9P0BM01_CHRIL|nr:unnamed protein product [Chrysodeixis includens]